MSRKNARETLYKLVFEYLFTKELNEQTETLLLYDASLSEDDRDYIRAAYDGIAAHYDELCSRITKYTTGYSSVDRLVKGDLTAFIIGDDFIRKLLMFGRVIIYYTYMYIYIYILYKLVS